MTAMLFLPLQFAMAQNNELNGRAYSVRSMTLKNGLDTNAFEKHAKTILVNAYGQVPGVEARLVRADRGEDTGTYLLLYFFDSIATRDYYYPIEDGTQLPEVTLLMHSKIEKAVRGLYEYVEEEPEDSNYTDYVVIE